MYCTAPLSPRKGRLRSSHDDDDDDEVLGMIRSTSRIRRNKSVNLNYAVAATTEEFGYLALCLFLIELQTHLFLAPIISSNHCSMCCNFRRRIFRYQTKHFL